MLETDFSLENTFLTLDTTNVGEALATLGTINELGIGDGVSTNFTGILSNFPVNQITNIKIDGVSIGALTSSESNDTYTIIATGFTGEFFIPNGNFDITFTSAPLLGEVITLEFTSLQSEWSSISGIRKGYRILTDNETGLIELSSDPQFQQVSTPALILVPPSSLRYEPGEWKLRVPSTKKVGDYVPSHISSTLILPEYFDSLQNVFIDELHDSIIRLRNIRIWNKMDEDYLDLYLQTLGMTFKSEIFDIETRRRFIKELTSFIQLSGTKYTFNYLSFVVGAFFITEHLWSKDYITFILKDDIPLIEQDLYYPTNHVQLTFDANVFGTLEPALIISIFYVLASVPLVLERINQELEANILNINSVLIGTYEVYLTAEDVT